MFLHSTTAVQIYCGSIGRVTCPPPPAVPLFLRQVGVAALRERDWGLYGGREASRGLPLLTEGGQQRIADHVDTQRSWSSSSCARLGEFKHPAHGDMFTDGEALSFAESSQ